MPRKHCRNLVRSRKSLVLNKDTRMVSMFCLAGTWRTISQRHAEQMEEAGETVRSFRANDDGTSTAYWTQVMKDPSKPSPTTLTMATMEAVANSKNCRLSRSERNHVEKYQVWALIGDTKAVAVRPRISEADRIQAEKLLGIRAA